MKVFIPGGAGYLGSVLTEKLLEYVNVDEVVVMDNLMYNQSSLINLCKFPGFDFVYGDVLKDFELAKKYVEWADVIIPLCAYVGVPICEKVGKEKVYQLNYEFIVKICELVKNTDKKVLFPNSNSGYGITTESDDNSLKYCTELTDLNPISTYGDSKKKAENHLMSEIPDNVVIFRLATVFGSSPRMRTDLLVNDFVLRAMKDGVIVLYEKDFMRNYIHIQDVANCFLFALKYFKEMKGQIYNVGLSSANLSKLELCKLIQKYVKFDILKHDTKSDPDKRNYIVSNEKIEKAGFSPVLSIEDGILELMKVYNITLNLNNNFGNV